MSDPEELPEHHRNQLSRIRDHLPENDLEFMVLKGHLLVEELLISIIDKMLFDSGELKGARLTFFQRLCLVRSFLPKSAGAFQHAVELVEKLNQLRNAMSHSLEPLAFEKRVQEFNSLAESNLPIMAHSNGQTDERRLRLVIIAICAILKKVAHEKIDGLRTEGFFKLPLAT